MIIDWQKYGEWLTPLRLRSQLLLELIRVLIWQIPRSNSSFSLWLETAKYKAALNASVIVLQQAIQREFGVYATITELDGQPTDFLVSIDGTVDENRVKALIDTYKLAGKSYVFALGSVSYSSSWINYQCENIIELITAEWTDYVCEDDGVVLVTGYLSKNDSNEWIVTVNASRAVKSEINISGTINGVNDGDAFFAGDFTGNILVNTNSVIIPVTLTEIGGSYYIIDEGSVDLIPNSDAVYSYEYQNLV